MNTPSLTLVAVMAALSLGAAQAAPLVPLQFNAQGRFEQQLALEPGKFVEVCGPVPVGTPVKWQFKASAPLDFNIHYHQGKEVVTPTRATQVSQAADTLLVAGEPDHCWMWVNKGAAPATVSVELQR